MVPVCPFLPTFTALHHGEGTPDALGKYAASTTVHGSTDLNPDSATYGVTSGKFPNFSVNLHFHLGIRTSNDVYLITS